MPYKQLDQDSVIEYIKSVPEMKQVFSSFDNLNVSEIGDGNLNFVYNVTNNEKPKETVIVKQAVPFLRIVGESWPLPKERMNFEIMALQHAAKYCPALVPEIYHASHEMCLIIMQNLTDHKVIRGEIIQGKYFPRLAEDTSTYMAENLFHTTDWFLDHKTKKELVGKFINVDLCKITEDFVFTNPYEKSDTNSFNPELTQENIDFIQKDSELKLAVAEMKYKFMNNAEALLHGDLHIGSIMANEDETYVIDPEFAFFGPIGFDIGAFIGNLIMAYFSHEHRQKLLGNEPYQYRKWLLDTVEATWELFEQKFDKLWADHQEKENLPYWQYEGGKEAAAEQRKRFIRKIFSDTVGFAACKMMRRILGLAKVADIADIEDLKERARIERMTLKMGKQMVINRDSYSSIQELTALAKELSPLV
ncbi:5-methylthioribose kinase [Denitrovibrio acetiphilus DSM 12809]|uniref:S-methyl-5-thioribose kinase n=1 Tax=Denitrovibrio acetiphilus (strain DSM 12809 / NBRC 114555 / N2460) TaxID=522772 RepID=D4H278_DENA2|nr:S-methyl-5-thioribose kinase [Denitrovibrio acetiphilus]ADD68869.1 5-methylthioribose kinase [Denitrovibrio acetiphilus DSM 12809]